MFVSGLYIKIVLCRMVIENSENVWREKFFVGIFDNLGYFFLLINLNDYL